MVYVVQEVPGRDIMSASTFGDLALLLPPGDVVLSAGPTMTKLRRELRDFGDDDFLLLMGDPVAIGMATTIAATVNRGVVKMLKWDRRSCRYYPVVFDMNNRLDPTTVPIAIAQRPVLRRVS